MQPSLETLLAIVCVGDCWPRLGPDPTELDSRLTKFLDAVAGMLVHRAQHQKVAVSLELHARGTTIYIAQEPDALSDHAKTYLLQTLASLHRIAVMRVADKASASGQDTSLEMRYNLNLSLYEFTYARIRRRYFKRRSCFLEQFVPAVMADAATTPEDRERFQKTAELVGSYEEHLTPEDPPSHATVKRIAAITVQLLHMWKDDIDTSESSSLALLESQFRRWDKLIDGFSFLRFIKKLTVTQRYYNAFQPLTSRSKYVGLLQGPHSIVSVPLPELPPTSIDVSFPTILNAVRMFGVNREHYDYNLIATRITERIAERRLAGDSSVRPSDSGVDSGGGESASATTERWVMHAPAHGVCTLAAYHRNNRDSTHPFSYIGTSSAPCCLCRTYLHAQARSTGTTPFEARVVVGQNDPVPASWAMPVLLNESDRQEIVYKMVDLIEDKWIPWSVYRTLWEEN
ncbi:hypothetical protein PLICRDRAFT_177781 [Plicaturopsis crispa FD-325 SS-3]|nr:hypothetical protein PLICRDRAFT_177781 [Plicaturopsis crispa FD-325 SS-3]